MKTSPDRWFNLLSLLFVAMMGASILTLLPLWVGGLSDQGNFSQQQIGWLAAADVVGIFLSSASALFWVRKVHWRTVTLAGLALFLLGNLASLAASDFVALMLVRIIAGMGCGSAYAIALAGLGDHRRPPMAFGLMVSAQVAFGTIGFFIVPRIMEDLGIAGFFHYLNGWLVVALILVALAFPGSDKASSSNDSRSLAGLFNTRSILVFATTVVYYCGVSAVWAYFERIGVGLGLESAAVGDILGIGFAISGLGSLATPWVSGKIGRIPALVTALMTQVATMACLIGSTSVDAYLLYAATSIIFQFFWSFAIPLLMDQFNRVDDTGRFIVLCASAFKVGEILGPPLAAALITETDFSGVLWLGIGCMAVALALAITTERGSDASAANAQPAGEPA